MVICAVATFKSRTGCSNKVSFHRFPANAENAKIWKNLCKRKDDFNLKTFRICLINFEVDCFQKDLQNELLGLPLRHILLPFSIPLWMSNSIVDSNNRLEEEIKVYEIERDIDGYFVL